MKILAFAASLRTGSWNARLLERVVSGAREAGGDVTVLDLKLQPLPLYDGDLEAAGGPPAHATALKDLIRAHAGLLVVTPEYNGGMPPLLVNLLAWTSRPTATEGPGAVFRQKPVGLASASPVATGGMRVLSQAAHVFGVLGAFVVPYATCVSDAAKAFGPGPALASPALDQRVRDVGGGVARFLATQR